MATVNLLNYDWNWSTKYNVTSGNVNDSYVSFAIPDGYSGYLEKAKAYTIIPDISKYRSITLKYDSCRTSGISGIIFGIFDSTSAESKNGIYFDSFSSSGGTITIGEDDLSGLSGTKYVGFQFSGNSYFGNSSSPGVETYGYPSVKLTFGSLTATEKTYTLTYDANGGSGAPSAVNDIRSTTISSTVPTRPSHDFLGWSESKTATYATYFAGNTISLTSNKTLYAVWRKFYTVTYDANGGSNAPNPDKKIDGETIVVGTVLPTPPANTSVIYTVILNGNGGTCDPNTVTVTNVATYDFVNWNTKADGSGISYQFADLYSDNSDVTLYAQYNSTTTYNSVILPIPFRRGHDFMGWSANEEDTSGMIGEYTPTENETTLYATWKRRGLVYICDNAREFSAYEVFIYDGSGWSLYVPYIYTESGWIEYSG